MVFSLKKKKKKNREREEEENLKQKWGQHSLDLDSSQQDKITQHTRRWITLSS